LDRHPPKYFLIIKHNQNHSPPYPFSFYSSFYFPCPFTLLFSLLPLIFYCLLILHSLNHSFLLFQLLLLLKPPFLLTSHSQPPTPAYFPLPFLYLTSTTFSFSSFLLYIRLLLIRPHHHKYKFYRKSPHLFTSTIVTATLCIGLRNSM
jgi:hypothetical protein